MPNRRLTVIGENIHATRVALRKGTRITEKDGIEVILYTTAEGEQITLAITEAAKKTKDYEEGRVKHVQIAIETAMDKMSIDPSEGTRYLDALVRHQEKAGAAFLDLNIDEISTKLEVQTAAMSWLSSTIQDMTDLPLSIDSSSIDVIRSGLNVVPQNGPRPMLNSASLERLDALELAREHNCRVVITAAGEKGMPDSAVTRVTNASRMVEAAIGKGFSLDDLYIDPLVFPISVDNQFGHHCLDAIRELRSQYGPEVHITGGMSNVSFGLPSRKLLNEMFVVLAIEAGADSAIMDPVVSPLDKLLNIDRSEHGYRLAEEVILGRDDYCANYIRAWRKGEFSVN